MRTLVATVVLSLMAIAGIAQEADKRPHELHGKVTDVNISTKSLTVDHQAVPGWMDAMTMTYPVDKESVLQRLKAGDQITATVYVGDLTLHNIQIVKGNPKNP